ncbi:SET domain-containing protein [Fastidiosibacter lacustris]|uniref:SET domain-containing protein n=1 Tax=Fastidiosibacter lacustris TaxID=2056695 RepID=UPI000E34F2E8|nr:SET domain-containing protein [Fastidiosibacter lacustris]
MQNFGRLIFFVSLFFISLVKYANSNDLSLDNSTIFDYGCKEQNNSKFKVIVEKYERQLFSLYEKCTHINLIRSNDPNVIISNFENALEKKDICHVSTHDIKKMILDRGYSEITMLHIAALFPKHKLYEEILNLIRLDADAIEDITGATPEDIRNLVFIDTSKIGQVEDGVLYSNHIKKSCSDIIDSWHSNYTNIIYDLNNVLSKNFGLNYQLKLNNESLKEICINHNICLFLPNKKQRKKMQPKLEHLFKDEREYTTIETFYTTHSNTKIKGSFALQDISPGEVILEYPGKSSSLTEYETEDSSREYSYAYQNGNKIRGIASYINDCTPNVTKIDVLYKGAIRGVMVAIDTIKQGEQLCSDYGMHDIKRLRYENFNEKRLDSIMSNPETWRKLNKYVSNGSDSAHISTDNYDPLVRLLLNEGEQDLESIYNRSLLVHILNSPYVLLNLLLNKQITRYQLRLLDVRISPQLMLNYYHINYLNLLFNLSDYFLKEKEKTGKIEEQNSVHRSFKWLLKKAMPMNFVLSYLNFLNHNDFFITIEEKHQKEENLIETAIGMQQVFLANSRLDNSYKQYIREVNFNDMFNESPIAPKDDL